MRIHLYLNVLVETNETKNILNLYLAVAVAGQNGNGAPRNRGDEQEQLLSDGNDSRYMIYISILCFKEGGGFIDAYIMVLSRD